MRPIATIGLFINGKWVWHEMENCDSIIINMTERPPKIGGAVKKPRKLRKPKAIYEQTKDV